MCAPHRQVRYLVTCSQHGIYHGSPVGGHAIFSTRAASTLTSRKTSFLPNLAADLPGLWHPLHGARIASAGRDPKTGDHYYPKLELPA